MRYPVVLTPDSNDTVLVSFPDVPEAVSFGDTEDEALARGLDALLTVFDAFMKDKRDIPTPSARKGRSVEVPALDAAKIEMYRAMRAQGVTKYELARRLDWHGPQVDRVLKIRHGSQIDQVEAAFAALGKRLVVSVEDAREKVFNRVRHHHEPVHAGVLVRASRSGAVASVKRAAKKR